MIFSSNDIFLITGASSGIGRSVCLDLNSHGAFVICCARDINSIKSLNKESANPENIVLEKLDLSNSAEDISLCLKDIVKKHGKLKGMALIAGMQNIIPVSGITNSKLDEILKVNLISNIFLAKGFMDRRINSGPGSSLVFMSSIASKKGEAGLSMYAASKGALNSFAKSLAKEVSLNGIRVNSVVAGMVKTELLKKWDHIYTSEYLKKINQEYPLGIGNTECIAPSIRFLLSEDSKWITGTELLVDGGASL
mgnify:CR=1 FL=1|jgi:3-oxoacyl-[acyl-carrier protein] reductase